MGWTYEVEAWTKISESWVNGETKTNYGWIPIYTGESLLRTVWLMRKAKKKSGCVRLSWR